MKKISSLALLLAWLAVVSPAWACKFEQRSIEALLAASSTVFRAQITEVRVGLLPASSNRAKPEEVVEARYKVLEVLKGKPSVSGIVRDSLPNNKCRLGLTVGAEYVLIPDEHQMVDLPSGSFLVSNDAGNPSTQRLQTFRRLASVTAK